MSTKQPTTRPLKVSFRVTPKEKKLIEKEAKAHGTSVADYVRQVVCS
jgi:uncharacterized protein (DUF1778 family)